MPGKHSAKQKRQAKHIYSGYRERGVSHDTAMRIAWATVNKYHSATAGKRLSKSEKVTLWSGLMAAEESKHMGKHDVMRVFSLDDFHKSKRGGKALRKDVAGMAPGGAMSIPVGDTWKEKKFEARNKLALDQPHVPKPSGGMDDQHDQPSDATKPRQPVAAMQKPTPVAAGPAPKPPMVAQKSAKRAVSKALKWHSSSVFADHVASAPHGLYSIHGDGTTNPKHSSYTGELRYTPHGNYAHMKPPSVALGRGSVKALKKVADKHTSIRTGKTRKALSIGYSKTSGGGALRAPNRGFGKAATPPPVPRGIYLPGVHSPKSSFRKPLGIKKPAGMQAKSRKHHAGDADSLTKTYPIITASMSHDDKLSLKKKTKRGKVVEKSTTGDATMSKTDFNDLFKSELGADADAVLIECPHCDHAITKSEVIAKSKKSSKGKNQVSTSHGEDGDERGHGKTGPKVSHNRAGGAAKKTDHPTANQVTATEKSSSAGGKTGEERKLSKSEQPIIRGTQFHQIIDTGADEELAKAILEGRFGGGVPTQPIDKNHSPTRLF